MSRMNLVIMLASSLLVLGVLLAPGIFSSTAHANTRVVSITASGCPALQEYDGYDGSKTEMHNVAILQTRLFSWLGKNDPQFNGGVTKSGNAPTTVVDGYFGPGTLRLVQQVQQDSFGAHNSDPGKQVDGMVGPNTWGVLGGCTVPSDEVLPQGL